MHEIPRRLYEYVSQGEQVALATIVKRRGATPRYLGAQMIVHPLGKHVGTIGGGCGEADVIRTALDVIQTGVPATVHVDLTEPISLESTAVCGGTYTVYIEPWGREQEDRAFLEAWVQALQRRQPVVRLVILSGTGRFQPLVGARALYTGERWVGGKALHNIPEEVFRMGEHMSPDDFGPARVLHHHVDNQGTLDVFYQYYEPSPRLIIVGAGHIGAALARIAKVNAFQVTVIDDRPAFANRTRFPDADAIVVGPMADTLRDMPMDPFTYVVLVTRGHRLDFECLLAMLDKSVPYIGMIGSKRRVRAVFQLLEEEKGIARERLRNVYAPIGLDIGAETPAEIATAIMAEIILVRRGGTGQPMSTQLRRHVEGALA